MKAREEAQAALEVAAERMREQYDRRVREAPKFQVGDRVWLEATNIQVTRTRKLANRRLGPFRIVRVISEVNYELELPRTMHVHPVFHVGLLTPFTPDTIEGRVQPPPPPVIVDGDEEFEVESILDAKLERGKLKYLVHWKGYSTADNSWEEAANLEHSPDVIAAFYQAHPDAIGAAGVRKGLNRPKRGVRGRK